MSVSRSVFVLLHGRATDLSIVVIAGATSPAAHAAAVKSTPNLHARYCVFNRFAGCAAVSLYGAVRASASLTRCGGRHSPGLTMCGGSGEGFVDNGGVSARFLRCPCGPRTGLCSRFIRGGVEWCFVRFETRGGCDLVITAMWLD